VGALQNDKLSGPGIGASTNIVDHTRYQGGRSCILHPAIESTAIGSAKALTAEIQAFIELAGQFPHDAVPGLMGDPQKRAS